MAGLLLYKLRTKYHYSKKRKAEFKLRSFNASSQLKNYRFNGYRGLTGGFRGLTCGFLLLQNFSVAISVSSHVCFILVLILISVFLR